MVRILPYRRINPIAAGLFYVSRGASPIGKPWNWPMFLWSRGLWLTSVRYRESRGRVFHRPLIAAKRADSSPLYWWADSWISCIHVTWRVFYSPHSIADNPQFFWLLFAPNQQCTHSTEHLNAVWKREDSAYHTILCCKAAFDGDWKILIRCMKTCYLCDLVHHMLESPVARRRARAVNSIWYLKKIPIITECYKARRV